jgi:uncharacterized phage protein gp47/JayE
MPTTLAELVTTKTQAEMREALFAELAARGFPVSSWREGDVARTLVEIDAQALADESAVVAAIAKGGLLSEATGGWLTLLAREVYDLERKAAVATQGTVRLTASAEAGPYTIAPGQLWFASASGLRFQSVNTVQLTLEKGGTLDLTVQAESPGAAYNVANGTIAAMVTPLAGVTCANPDPGGGTWITTQGVDEESDAALVSRCAARWPEAGYGSPAASYDLWARTASSAITRTKVQASGSVGGQVDVWVAGPSGPVSAGDVSAAQSYIAARAPLTSSAVVANATALAVTVTATLYGAAAYQTSALASAQAALQALIASIPVGGKVYRSAIIGALMAVEGVQNVSVSAPASDTTMTASQVATLTSNLTWSSL